MLRIFVDVFRAYTSQAYHERLGRRALCLFEFSVGRLFEPLCVGDSPAFALATCQEQHKGNGKQRGGAGGHIPQAGLWHTFQRPQRNTHAAEIGYSAHQHFVHSSLNLSRA